jgi:hypothetical protein
LATVARIASPSAPPTSERGPRRCGDNPGRQVIGCPRLHGDLQAISCTSSHFCAAVDLSGNAVTYNGATWSSPSYVDPAVHASYGLTGVSCPLASFCAAVDWEGNALTATG